MSLKKTALKLFVHGGGVVQTVSDKTQDVMSDAAVVLSSLPQPVCHVLNTEHAFLTHIRYQKIGTYSHTLLL